MSQLHSVDYFLKQDSFNNWILGINEADCKYWDKWILENPNERQLVMQAVSSFVGYDIFISEIPDFEVDLAWLKLKAKINNHEVKEKSITIY